MQALTKRDPGRAAAGFSSIAPLSELKSAVLRALHQHTRKGLAHDDVTLIALEICENILLEHAVFCKILATSTPKKELWVA